MSRAFVARQVLAAMLHHGLRGQTLVLLDHEELHRLARLCVWKPDCRAFEHARVHHDDSFDFVRIHVETRD
jgi:hypothetical protein